MIKRQVPLLFLTVLLLCVVRAYAYDDKITHPKITKESTIRSNLDNHLKNNMGIVEGIKYKYNGISIEDLLQLGSKNEDIGFRALNHFWNPIHNEGLHDVGCGWFWDNDDPWAFQWWDCWDFTGLPNRDWAIGEAQDGSNLDDCGTGNHSRDDDCNDYC